MSDKELLEAAARAAGYPFDEGHFQAAERPGAWWGWVYIDGSGDPPEDSAWTELWNPLTDDGDALRLAVKCNLDIELQEDCVFANGFEVQNYQLFEWHKDDPYAATRRAIVRAAAEIGRNKA